MASYPPQRNIQNPYQIVGEALTRGGQQIGEYADRRLTLAEQMQERAKLLALTEMKAIEAARKQKQEETEAAAKAAEATEKTTKEKTLSESFSNWQKDADRFLRERANVLTDDDANLLAQSMPAEISDYGPAKSYFQRLQIRTHRPPGSPASSGRSPAYNPAGVWQNIEEIDRAIAGKTTALEALTAAPPPQSQIDPAPYTNWSRQVAAAQAEIARLGQERRRYQSRVKPSRPTPTTQPRPLTQAKAQEYLKRTGGDKDKARKLAKQEGWTF